MKFENKRSAVAEQIGKKIRELRLSAGLTQKQLAGDIISRNMLSMIESGTALPSIETLLHISEMLSVSPGFFFADENDLKLLGKEQATASAYSLIDNSEYETAAEVCRQYAQYDTEMRSLLVLCLMRMAEDYLSKYMLVSAVNYFESAAKLAKGVPYIGDSIIKMCDFSVTLAEYAARDTVPESLIDYKKYSDASIPVSFLAYLSAYKAVKGGDAVTASAIARSGMLGEFHSLHIRGAVHMENKDYEDATTFLDLALTSNGGGFFSRYKLLCDLEECRKNVGDFELAYSLSTGRMEMLGMFSK